LRKRSLQCLNGFGTGGPGLKIAAAIKNNFMTDKKQDQPLSKPDPETLHTTDPEEHMEGPVSSAMQKIRENAEDNDHPQREDSSEDGRTSQKTQQD
jgi:hypothetical protein